MPANVGEMFYTGAVPWHGKGLALANPVTMEEAIRSGGLDWEVGKVDLMTRDDPPSPVRQRQALVRLDLPSGHEDRVLGVAYRGFKPVQNRDGAMLFDAIFGQGKPVYHTGGYLGKGEKVWLLARIDQPKEVAPGDIVTPYALFANSHDGSLAFHIRLTTIRVVCQNTLSIALYEKNLGRQFRRAHQGSIRDHAQAAQHFFSRTLEQFNKTAEQYTSLSKKACNDLEFRKILNVLFPEPKKPRNSERYPGLLKAWEKRKSEVQHARKDIDRLRESGIGMDLEGSKGTYWGVLNAVLEYVDHHKETKGSSLPYALIGDGMKLKMNAFRLIRDAAKAA